MKTRLLWIFICLSSFSTGALAQGSSLDLKTWGQQLKSQLNSSPSKAAALLSPKALRKLENQLLSARNPQIGSMEKARRLFAAGQFDQALDLYHQVSPGSDQWLEAVEERGWSYHRQKDYEKALAQTKTLLSQAFLPIVGPEPFFLQSLSQLKICDYKGILETHKLFKETQKVRLVEIQTLADTGDSLALISLPSKVMRFPIAFKDVGEEAKVLPRLFYRDRVVQKALMDIRLSQVALDELQAKADLPQAAALTPQLMKMQEEGQQQLRTRMRELAKRENEENFKIVQKLNLIEVETVQRVHTDQELDRKSYSKGAFAQASKDDLVFPDDGHPWLDEVDKFQVKVNSCPQNIRRKM